VKFGAEPIDSKRFFYYKSLVAKLENDQQAIDRDWQMYRDASFLSTFAPILTTGAGKMDRDVLVPAAVTDMPANAKAEVIKIADPSAALQSLHEAERSATESSIDPQMSGSKVGAAKTKAETLILQQNNEVNLGVIGRMVGIMVRDVGGLMVDNIIRYQTTGEVTEIIAGIPRMKFRTFMLPNKVKGGRNVTESIKFTDRFDGVEMSSEDKDKEELGMYEQYGDDRHVYEVNPELFSRMDYLITIDYEALTRRNTAFERAFKLEVYDKGIMNPLIDQVALTRDFLLEPLVKGEASKYLKSVDNIVPGIVPGMLNAGQGGGQDMSSRLVRSGTLPTKEAVA
jgi:hypothetical protein